jgi:hypothetical protein
MIWGVPIGNQTIHVDVDLSDIGCFSLRPYDFIRQGVGVDAFEILPNKGQTSLGAEVVGEFFDNEVGHGGFTCRVNYTWGLSC